MTWLISQLRNLWHHARRTSTFGGDVALNAGTNILNAVIGLTTGMLAARLLGPDGRGELAAIQMWPTTIGTLAMLGLTEALVYFSAKNPERSGTYLGTAIAIALVSSLFFMPMGYAIMPWLLNQQQTDVVNSARWFLLIVPVYAVLGMAYHPFRGRQDFVRWNAMRVLPNIGWLLLLCWAWFYGVSNAKLLAMAQLGMLTLLIFFVGWVVIKRIPGPFRPQLSLTKPLITFGAPSVLTSIPQVLNYKFDQMVLAAFLPPSVLGLYVVAVSWGNIVTPLASAIASAVFPKVAALDDPHQQALACARSVRVAVLVSSVIGLLLALVTPLLLPFVFGSRFSEAVVPAQILILACILGGINMVLSDGLRGLGRPYVVLWAELSGLILSALSIWLLLTRLGIAGAAIASSISSITVTIFLVFKLSRVTSLGVSQLLLPRAADLQKIIVFLISIFKSKGIDDLKSP